ncbi:MAG: hypothetical protein KatS3mg105_2342 [Gemmatales bacterium]|nr:MAG: hypothetical protein KatS3mg105_2342 [Gemmatales bacterium]
MLLRKSKPVRPGVAALEAAFVFPLVILFTLGMIVGAFGIFRYQEVAWLARDAARFASTHGGQYYEENKELIQNGVLPDVDKQYIIDKIIKNQAGGLDPNSLSVNITIVTAQGEFDWDAPTVNGIGHFNRYPTSIDLDDGTAYQNIVKVTVSYNWVPEYFWSGPITLTSTSEMPMNY